jgi:hypothetical protein
VGLPGGGGGFKIPFVGGLGRLTSFDRKVGLGVYFHGLGCGLFLLYRIIDNGLIDVLDWSWRGHFEEVKGANNPGCSSVKSIEQWTWLRRGATVRSTPNQCHA